jgi:hypothetical protein
MEREGEREREREREISSWRSHLAPPGYGLGYVGR